MRRELIAAERAALLGLRNEGRVRNDIVRRVERDLDLDEARIRPRVGSRAAMTGRRLTQGAWGYGLATIAEPDDRVLDTWYPEPQLGTEPPGADVARGLGQNEGPHELAAATGRDERRGVRTVVGADRDRLARRRRRPTRTTPTCACTCSRNRLIAPHQANLGGIFGVLANVAWTTHGPVDPAALAERADALPRRAASRSRCTAVDKFPRMTDYVVPAGVRIADADRVRLGAHLAEGTTVMHEGFVNYNAGTLGAIDGRGPDLGRRGRRRRLRRRRRRVDHGHAQSGGGTEVISVGERCLLGANSGLGISLGDDCVVEAGLYVTAGSRVDAARRRGRQGRGAERRRTACCSGATRSPARSRRCRAAGAGAASTRRCTAQYGQSSSASRRSAARSHSASVGTSASRR